MFCCLARSNRSCCITYNVYIYTHNGNQSQSQMSIIPSLYYVLYTQMSIIPSLYYVLYTQMSIIPSSYCVLYTCISYLTTVYHTLMKINMQIQGKLPTAIAGNLLTHSLTSVCMLEGRADRNSGLMLLWNGGSTSCCSTAATG